MSGTMTISDQRSYIVIEILRGKNPTEIHCTLSEACGVLTVDRSTVSGWANRFRGGCVSIDNGSRSGRPRTSRDERSVKLWKIVLKIVLQHVKNFLQSWEFQHRQCSVF